MPSSKSEREHAVRKHAMLLAFGLLALAAFALVGSLCRVAAASSSGYHVVRTISVPGEDGWDYLTVDSDARRVYISHGTHVVVMNADTYAIEGDIPDTPGVHGIAIASDLGRGFISSGRANIATIFDLKSLKTIGTVNTDANPDAIAYDPVSKRVFTFNGRGKNTTAINAVDGSVIGTLALGGKPEFAVADGKGNIFVNNEDTSELMELATQTVSETHRWPLAPCKSPSGLAMDRKNRRLFSVCDEGVMSVMDPDKGKVVATPAICDGPDAAAFDPATDYVFASCGDGILTVIHEDSPDKFTVIDSVSTKKSARTMGLDLKTHNIFLPAADFDPPAPGERRGKMKPGSFVILIVANERAWPKR